MEQFNLEEYKKNPNRKVVTRQCKSVRIICTDRRHTDSWPIVALEDYGDGEFVIYANIDGRTDMCSENIHDLFFADEEEELTEFELRLLSSLDYTRIYRQDYSEEDMLKIIKDIAQELLDLARKEIRKEQQEKLGTLEMPIDVTEPYYIKGKQDALKDLPKWKKATECKEFEVHVCVIDEDMYPYLDTEVHKGEYYIELDDLKTLPKEE